MNKLLILFTLAVIITYASVNAACVAGQNNCQLCVVGQGVSDDCQTCQTGSYIDSKRCHLCSTAITNCKACDEKSKCKTCQDKFTLSEDGTKCAFSSKIAISFLALVAALIL